MQGNNIALLLAMTVIFNCRVHFKNVVGHTKIFILINLLKIMAIKSKKFEKGDTVAIISPSLGGYICVTLFCKPCIQVKRSVERRESVIGKQYYLGVSVSCR